MVLESTKPLWAWSCADTRQQIPGLSLALMALLLAASANIGVATMVSSFRLTFVGFLDQRLASELYIQTNSESESNLVEAYLTERGLEVLPLKSIETSGIQLPLRVFGIRVGPTYQENWVFVAGTSAAWDRVATGDAVIVNEQFARRTGVWVGDHAAITNTVTRPIAAVVGDYGNPKAQITGGAK